MIIYVMKTQRSLTFDESTWLSIDDIRGEIPRSRFIEKIVKKSIQNVEATTN